ncbi:Detected protein of unknown function [Hibiscus syriacus]|uniref:Uncharacterized protein n=1 Tax=Hibiscus syriacus TaxID=106335 RepID=A0A6A3C1N9_HIBSY|nr:Detected protein of unknown function [Hibiscus syriacus]
MPCNPHEYGLCNFTSISLGPHIYVLGGSLLDTLSFSLDRPSPSSSTFRYNFVTSSWDRLAPMIPRAGASLALRFSAPIKSSSLGVGPGTPCLGLLGVGYVRWRVSGDGEETEFWVMGGYGFENRLGELGDMWETGETPRFSKIVVVEDEEGCYPPAIFMLDDYDILR